MATRMPSLFKDGHKHAFCYATGCEGEVVSEMVRLATDKRTNFNRLGAAIMSFQAAQSTVVNSSESLHSVQKTRSRQ